MWRTGTCNVTLRGLTQLSKFLLLVFLARHFEVAEVGIWGLINITIAIGLYLLSSDFHIFNSREILAATPERRPVLIRNQLVYHLCAYAVVLPALLLIFAGGVIPWKYVGWFYLLLVLEHASHESVQLLVTLSRSTAANLIIFIRSGMWAWVVMATAWVLPDLRHLPFVWTCWAAGAVVGLAIAVSHLRTLPWDAARKQPVDFAWIRRGMKTALPFLMATLSFQLLNYADRYFLQHFHGEEAVGVYTFFAGMANAIHVIVFTGVCQVLFPRLISSYQMRAVEDYQRNRRSLVRGVVGLSVVLAAAALFLIRPVLSLLDRPEYAAEADVFNIMVASVVALCLSYVPHYALFVRRRDGAIISVGIVAMVVAIAGNGLLVPRMGLTGAALATLAAMSLLLVSKSLAAWYYRDVE
jgi:O-antigen/teichoic acid export membrane protein